MISITLPYFIGIPKNCIQLLFILNTVPCQRSDAGRDQSGTQRERGVTHEMVIVEECLESTAFVCDFTTITRRNTKRSSSHSPLQPNPSSSFGRLAQISMRVVLGLAPSGTATDARKPNTCEDFLCIMNCRPEPRERVCKNNPPFK